MKTPPQQVSESVRRFVLSLPQNILEQLQETHTAWVNIRAAEGIIRNRKCRDIWEFLIHLAQSINIDSDTGCWNWTLGLDPHGYGRIRWVRTIFYPHQLFLEIKEARTLNKGELACHHCDNRKCVNPDHLYRGNHKTNNSDCVNRGRHVSPDLRGERGPGHKLKTSQVVEIRSEGYSLCDAALKYGVSKTTICDIRNGKTWRNLL